MLFSSITFIYYFLPLLLVCYFIVPKKWRNIVLLIFSLVFYFLGEPKYILVLLCSCLFNYFISKMLDRGKARKFFSVVAIIYNVGQLLIFKYTDFFIENINNVFKSELNYLYIVMPIGISFFTFQALGYVIDVYKKKHKSADSLLTFMTYISLFPQLVAGPIVRYSDVEDDLANRKVSIEKFSEGVKRFIIGLSKKVLLANVAGEIVEKIVIENVVGSWLKPILFTLQIYFDFSGYSDMAIGLGKMFGFTFLENFNYPLIAKSVTDFWRRWHISLSSWFRDYIYIPLGGNRVSKVKWIRNIFVVWFLTGFWHGASWNFILWGLYFGVILVIEKVFLGKYIEKTKVLKYIYTILVVVISFLIFNSNSLREIGTSLEIMFGIRKVAFISEETLYYLKSNIIFFGILVISATPLWKNIVTKLKSTKVGVVVDIVEPIVYIGLLLLATAFLIDASFNPFLYFRF